MRFSLIGKIERNSRGRTPDYSSVKKGYYEMTLGKRRKNGKKIDST